MPQQQCPWCGHCGPRYDERSDERPAPHSDGSSCVCRHITCQTRIGALYRGGRYFDRSLGRWACPSCGTAPVATDAEQAIIDDWRSCGAL